MSSGCSPDLLVNKSLEGKNKSNEVSNALIYGKYSEKLNKELQKIDPRLSKILGSPSILSAKKRIEAAQQNVLIINSQTETAVTAISNIGPKLDNDKLEVDATAGVSFSKLINDGGALSANVDNAKLNVEISKLLYIQKVNIELLEVIKSEQIILNFKKIEEIYNEQLDVYNKNLPLIKTAEKANIISKTDVLKLEQLKLGSEEKFLTAKSAADAANLVRKKYQLNETDDFLKLNLNRWREYEVQSDALSFINRDLIQTQIDIMEKEIEMIEATYSANVSLTGTASANVTDMDNSLGFVGLNITVPIKDGGRKEFQIQEKINQVEALDQERKDLDLLIETSMQALNNYYTIYKERSKLLTDQIENSKKIADDLELKLRAGAASVIDLATEKMNYYNLRRQNTEYEYQLLNEILNFYQLIGRQCDLTDFCGQINLSLS